MAHMKVTILSAAPCDGAAEVEYVMDGMYAGTETVHSLALAVLTGCWDDPRDMVGKVFERDIN